MAYMSEYVQSSRAGHILITIYSEVVFSPPPPLNVITVVFQEG